MGQSTDAILAYGYDLNALTDEAEIDLEELIPQEIREKIAEMPGHYDLEESIPDYLKLNGVSYVQLVHHCSCDYTMHILGIEAARSWRGDVRRLDLEHMTRQAHVIQWPTHVQRAAEVLGINIKNQTPGWMLVSMWC